MCFRRWKESTWNCIKKYDSDKKPHKKKKTAKNNAGHFSDYLERKAKENMETKKDAANSKYVSLFA